MREIVLSPGFVQAVQERNEEYNILNTVQALAKAMDELPAVLAEDMIFHMLVTDTLGGRLTNQEELHAALIELFRLRGEKKDGFSLPSARWSKLANTQPYQIIAEKAIAPLNMELILHTIENYLETYSEPDDIKGIIERMQYLENNVRRKTNEDNVITCFCNEIMDICGSFYNRDGYLENCACDSPTEFVIAFAELFILMAQQFEM